MSMHHRCCGPCPMPGPKPCEPIDSFAQYSVTDSPPSGSFLAMHTVFQEGDAVNLGTETEIILKPGYLYLVDYLFLATPGEDGYMQILPRIDGRPGLLYSFFAPSGSQRNASASGSFTVRVSGEEEGTLNFQLTYAGPTSNIDVSGAVSVTPLLRLPAMTGGE